MRSIGLLLIQQELPPSHEVICHSQRSCTIELCKTQLKLSNHHNEITMLYTSHMSSAQWQRVVSGQHTGAFYHHRNFIRTVR